MRSLRRSIRSPRERCFNLSGPIAMEARDQPFPESTRRRILGCQFLRRSAEIVPACKNPTPSPGPLLCASQAVGIERLPPRPSGGPTRDVCGALHFSRWNGAVSETALRQGLCSRRPRPPPDDDAAFHVGARAASTWAVRSERPGLPRSSVNPRHASSTSDRRREKHDGFHRHSTQDS